MEGEKVERVGEGRRGKANGLKSGVYRGKGNGLRSGVYKGGGAEREGE